MTWFIVLTVMSFTLQLARPTGWLGSDDAGYYSAAEFVIKCETIQRLHHHYARTAMILPIAVSLAVFGDCTWAVALPTFAASIGCLILVALLGRLLWGWWEGLCAATLLSVVPYFRVLSTTAYPDLPACFWSTAAAVLAVVAFRTASQWRFAIAAIGAGLCTAIAISTKVFAAPVVLFILAIGVFWSEKARRFRWTWCVAVGVGIVLGLGADALANLGTSGDAMFNLRAHLSSQSEAAATGTQVIGDRPLASILWQRAMLPFRLGDSGWGLIGAAFWPVVLGSCLLNRTTRFLAGWALAVFLPLAMFPISLKNGWELFPHFHGRHLITAMIPFTLCLAWMVARGFERFASPRMATRCWPVIPLAGLGFFALSANDIGGFRNRDTQRIGEAIRRFVVSYPFAGDREIFMTPSTYWRFRILFPPELRARLRVAAGDDSPTWWRDTTVDIVERREPLPSPDQTYLIATPVQLRGESEPWDYDVALPRGDLEAWQRADTLLAFTRTAHQSVQITDDSAEQTPFLLLVGGDDHAPRYVAGASQASTSPYRLSD